LWVIKNDKAIGCDGIQANIQKTFVTKDGAEIFTKFFNMIRNKKESPKERKTVLTQQIYNGKGNLRKCTNYRGLETGYCITKKLTLQTGFI